MTTTSDIRRDILEVLALAGEDGMTIAAISTATKFGQASLRPVLSELGGTMAIRSTQAGRNVRFWIPSEARLLAEEQSRQVRIAPPLKIDKQRSDLYARLNAERGEIKSIG